MRNSASDESEIALKLAKPTGGRSVSQCYSFGKNFVVAHGCQGLPPDVTDYVELGAIVWEEVEMNETFAAFELTL